MPGTLQVQHLSVSINRPFDNVNEFLSVPQNFEKWAAGLGNDFRQVDGEWVFGAGDGMAKIRFTPKNPFGVADHTVVTPQGMRSTCRCALSPTAMAAKSRCCCFVSRG